MLKPYLAALALVMATPAAAGGRTLVVANLPYSVSGPLLAELCALPQLPERCVLLVQKELAQRIAAPAGDPEYGGLAVQVQALYRAKLVRDVGPQVFRPRPKVVSVEGRGRAHQRRATQPQSPDRRIPRWLPPAGRNTQVRT